MSIIKHDGDTIEIRKMNRDEIPDVAELYKRVKITSYNYKDAFSEGEKSFSSRGGMFLISDENDILKVFEDSSESIIVGIYHDKICGMLWYGKWNVENFPEMCIADDCAETPISIDRQGNDGTLAYAKEIISCAPESAGIMSLAMFGYMMEDFCDRGIIKAIGEVYRINAFYDKDGCHKCNFLNNPSYNMLLSTGGKQIGTSAIKHLDLDGYSVDITPQVMLWNTEESKNKISTILASKEWKSVIL